MPGLTKEQIQTFFDKRYSKSTSPLRVEKTYEKGARLRLVVEPHHLRPGDTVSGPALMTLVDASVFVAILGEIGPVFQAVTTNLNINLTTKTNVTTEYWIVGAMDCPDQFWLRFRRIRNYSG